MEFFLIPGKYGISKMTEFFHGAVFLIYCRQCFYTFSTTGTIIKYMLSIVFIYSSYNNALFL